MRWKPGILIFKRRAHFFLICLGLWPIFGWAQSLQLNDLFSYSPYSADHLPFVLIQSPTASIAELRLHFLTGKDCYSGYLKGLRIQTKATPFPIRANEPFALTGIGLFQAAQSILNPDELTSIQAVLIRFVDPKQGTRYQQFARFLGSCADQGINCCLPVNCSLTLGSCVASYKTETQALTWLPAAESRKNNRFNPHLRILNRGR